MALILTATDALSQRGGCEFPDPRCVPADEEERILQVLEQTPDGELFLRNDLAWPLPGRPMWSTSGTLADGSTCFFAALGDTSEVIGKKRGGPTTSRVPSGGLHPVRAEPTLDGRFLLVANYANTLAPGASVASFHKSSDCSLRLADSKSHEGSSVDSRRQQSAHVHALVPMRHGIAIATDLGQDLIFLYEVDDRDGTLRELSRTRTAPGSGPRHAVQHPLNASLVFVIHEMGQFVAVYELSLYLQSQHTPPGATAQPRSLRLVCRHSLVFQDSRSVLDDNGAWPSASDKAAEIVIRSDGQFLYASNRGPSADTVSVFQVLPGGQLAMRQRVDVARWPRGMALTHGDGFLLVAEQTHGTVTAYSVGRDDGRLSPTSFKSAAMPHTASLSALALGSSAALQAGAPLEGVTLAFPAPLLLLLAAWLWVGRRWKRAAAQCALL